GAGDPRRRCHCRRLHSGRFRARPEGRTASASRRLLQPAISYGCGHRVVGPERQPRGRCWRRRVRGPRSAASVLDRIARRRDDRAGQSGTQLRTVPVRTLLPMVLHVVIALAAGYSVGSEFHRRSMRAWLACAGGNPIVALAGKLAPLFAIFFIIMLSMPLILEGLLGISFKGNAPMMVIAAMLLIVSY